ncbi:protein of unknown function [Catalinimonas alkaloidigena]|uniref:DUF1206 domain-containing protein n=1 Tax=Catalinimonas alkaloidigena TaxID=1075417 RepID=A0A1G8WJX8_9BACT|nr:DUF1206 domain-containing protein [Catalinimonas alkaloidigena]SDJ78604.1 protein of unknown function [Catalinimonas alkaloidigena]
MDTNKEQWIENYARFGVAAKGVVYCLVGILAAMAATGNGGQTTGKSGVFKTILAQPFGQILLGLVAFGLLGYVTWRFIQAIKDPNNKGNDAKGIATRLGYAFSGVVYLALAISAISLLFGQSGGSGGSGGSGDSRELLVSKLLEQPFGQWLVGLVAVGTVAKGIYQIYRALSGNYMKNVKSMNLEHKVREFIKHAGQVGYIARGVVLGIVGYFFFRAAVEANPNQAGGTSEAFSFLQNTSGPWLLAAVALGLTGYGIFMFVKAKYGRFAIA